MSGHVRPSSSPGVKLEAAIGNDQSECRAGRKGQLETWYGELQTRVVVRIVRIGWVGIERGGYDQGYVGREVETIHIRFPIIVNGNRAKDSVLAFLVTLHVAIVNIVSAQWHS
jgi:hypothetical protein